MKEFVADLATPELEEIVCTYELLEYRGYVGNYAIRTYAYMYMKRIGMNEGITRWMEILALAAYRELYYRTLGVSECHTK